MENKTELSVKQASLKLYSLREKISEKRKHTQDENLKKVFKDIESELKSIDSKLLKDFKISFSEKMKKEISNFI